MKKLTFFFLLIFFAGLISSCEKIKGKGEVVSESRNISGYTAIGLSIDGNVYFTPDSIYKLEIHAQQNILDVIETPVEGNRLVIKYQDSKSIGQHEPISIYISAPNISDLNISGSGSFHINGNMNESSLGFTISGSGDFRLGMLQANRINANISGSGSIFAETGEASEEYLTISGSGNINMIDVVSDSVFVNISGSGDVYVYAVKYLEVNISGSGNVRYNGNPIINQNISGSGSIIHI
jgi:hypothetical protein